jgi:hypothetical protein
MMLTALVPDLRRVLSDQPVSEPRKTRQDAGQFPDDRRSEVLSWLDRNGYLQPMIDALRAMAGRRAGLDQGGSRMTA